jgi:endoglucanase
MVEQYRGVNISGAEGGKTQTGDKYPGQVWTDFYWPDESDLTPFLGAANGGDVGPAAIIRYPVKWERCVESLGGELRADATKALDKVIDLCEPTNTVLVIDIHNYNRFKDDQGTEHLLSFEGEVKVSDYCDFVARLSARYADRTNVAICLMNEPHDLGTWDNGDSSGVGLAKQYQQAVTASRDQGFTGMLFIGPSPWNKVSGLDDGDEMGEELAKIVDPLNLTILDIHQYPDSGQEGNDSSIENDDPEIIAKRIQPGTDWGRRHGKKCLLGEWGSPNGHPKSIELSEKTVKYLEDNSDVWIGFCSWASGDWWPSSYYYRLTIKDHVIPPTVPPLKLGEDFPGGGTPPNPEPGPEPEPDDLEGRVEDLELAVSDLESRLTSLEDRVAALETGSGGSGGGSGGGDTEARLTALEDDVKALDERLDKIASGATG